jgi:hypothetical protein
LALLRYCCFVKKSTRHIKENKTRRDITAHHGTMWSTPSTAIVLGLVGLVTAQAPLRVNSGSVASCPDGQSRYPNGTEGLAPPHSCLEILMRNSSQVTKAISCLSGLSEIQKYQNTNRTHPCTEDL